MSRLVMFFSSLLVLSIAASASAQQIPTAVEICQALGMPKAPAGLEPDFETCCDEYFDCYADKKCDFVTDVPRATTPACFGCNVLLNACTGYALQGATPKWKCPASCDYSGVYCGASDGCGGVCVSNALCPLFRLRPEFHSVIFF